MSGCGALAFSRRGALRRGSLKKAGCGSARPVTRTGRQAEPLSPHGDVLTFAKGPTGRCQGRSFRRTAGPGDGGARTLQCAGRCWGAATGADAAARRRVVEAHGARAALRQKRSVAIALSRRMKTVARGDRRVLSDSGDVFSFSFPNTESTSTRSRRLELRRRDAEHFDWLAGAAVGRAVVISPTPASGRDLP